MEEDTKPRRSYIRRKRCLNESIKMVQGTLRTIAAIAGQQATDQDVLALATDHARAVEASCWSPRLHMSDEDYQQLTMAKTQELCAVLLRQASPHALPYQPFVLSIQQPGSHIAPPQIQQQVFFQNPPQLPPFPQPQPAELPVFPDPVPVPAARQEPLPPAPDDDEDYPIYWTNPSRPSGERPEFTPSMYPFFK